MFKFLSRSKRRNRAQRSLRRQFRAVIEKLEDRSLMAGLTAGNVVVERIGNGTTALSNAAAQINVLEYSPSGSVVQTLTSQFSGPVTAPSNLQTDSGIASSNGYLNLNGQYLAVPGYNSAVGVANVAGLNTKVGQIIDGSSSSLNVVTRALFPTGGPNATPPSPFSGNNFRSIYPTGSSTFYASGTSDGSPNTGGVWYYDGAGFMRVSSTSTLTNMRNVEIYNNQLYVSSSSGSFLGISSIGSGLPTTGEQTATLRINMGTGASPYGFVLFDTDNNGTLDRAYVADDRTNNSNGGINRFDFDGTNWNRASAFRFNTTTGQLSTATSGVAAIRGLSGSYDSATGTVTLYATTTENADNRLIRLLDVNSSAWSTSTTFTTLASAGTNFVFRGLDIYNPGSDTTPPTVTIDDGDGDDSVLINEKLTYTLTFSEAINAATLTSADFDNAGSATISIGAITAVSPSVFTVEVTPSTTGTVILRIPTGAVIADNAGNALVVPVQDDTTITVTSGDSTPPTVTSIDDGDADNLVPVNVALTYVVAFSEDIDAATVAAADFNNAGTANISIGSITETSAGVFSVVVTPTSVGTLQLRIVGTITDIAGNDLVVPVSDDTTLTVDATAPTVTDITNSTSGSVPAGSPVTYTVVFSEDIDAASVSADDFVNAGTSAVTMGAITETSPGVFSVVVTPTSAGTLKLRIPTGASITDVAGNALAVPVEDDTTITVTPVTTLVAGDIVVIGYNASGSPDTMTLLFLKDLLPGTRFFVSDNEVATVGGASFTDTVEAEATFTVKDGQTIPAGTVVTLPWGNQTVTDDRFTWTGHTAGGLGVSSGNFDDGIYIYTGTSATALTPTAFIFYVRGGSNAANAGNIPAGLSFGSTAINLTAAASRYKTTGAVYSGVPSQIRNAVGDVVANWVSGAPSAPSDWSFQIGPTFASAQVNGGAIFTNNNQRSQVTSVVVNFGSSVELQAGAFSIENIGLLVAGSSFIPQSQIVVTPSSGSATSFTITFDAGSAANGTNVNGVIKRAGGAAAAANGNSLADGNFVLRIDPAKVTGEGFNLKGDAAFGDVAADNFFRLYGDSDGDGDVDGTDNIAQRLAQSAFNAAFDWDGNGSVTAGADITNFVANRNKKRRAF